MSKISWWRTTFGEKEIQRIAKSMRSGCVSQGRVTVEFEQRLAEFLEVEYLVAVSSGSTALLLALMTVGVKPGDEVIVPNRTWIATAHAVYLLGAKVVLVDVEPGRPIIDASKIEQKLTPRTRAIIPVHMNGRSSDMRKILEIGKTHNLAVVEDAAQALASRNAHGFLGTQSDIGCFSLSVAKTISTGQGGFAVTRNKELAQRMRAIRTHGVESVKDPKHWVMPGFNYRFTDIQASIGIEQLKLLPDRVKHLRELYTTYAEGLQKTSFQLIPVDLETGEVPVYNEYLVEDREVWVEKLQRSGIETRPFYPDLDTASYFPQLDCDFPNSRPFGRKGVYLPSGPNQPVSVVNQIARCIKKNL